MASGDQVLSVANNHGSGLGPIPLFGLPQLVFSKKSPETSVCSADCSVGASMESPYPALGSHPLDCNVVSCAVAAVVTLATDSRGYILIQVPISYKVLPHLNCVSHLLTCASNA